MPPLPQATANGPVTATPKSERRFGGPIGVLVADIQGQVLSNCVGRVRDRTMLEVGTGSGRAALLMARGGAKVTAVDTSQSLLNVARRRADEQHITLKFAISEPHVLEFDDRSFEVGINLRSLMYSAEWEQSIAELCRVSNQLVVIAYPSSRSLAAVDAMGRRLFHAIGMQTYPYRVFSPPQIAAVLTSAGFRVRSMHRLFVLPLAFHRLIGSHRFTVTVEDLLDRLGLKKLFATPITVVAERSRPT